MGLRHSGLTLTAGLRIDVPFFTSRPVGIRCSGPSWVSTDSPYPEREAYLWSPRLGVSYQPGGRGFFRGGVGFFSGRPAYHWLSSVYSFTGLDASTQLLLRRSDVPAFTLDPPTSPRPAGGGLTSHLRGNYFDPAFRFPRNLRVALGTDLRLPGGRVGTVDLLYMRGVNQYYADRRQPRAPDRRGRAEGGRSLYGSHRCATGDATPIGGAPHSAR